MNFFEDTDLIFTRGPGGKIQSGGFTIFNRLLKSKVHPMYTINQRKPDSNPSEMKNVSSIFEGFVVPIGLYLSQDDKEKEEEEEKDTEEDKEEDEELDVYETLLALNGEDKPNSTVSKRKNEITKRIHPIWNKQKTKRNMTKN